LIFDDAFFSAGSGSFQLAVKVFWKREASSKNNENTVPISGGCGWERIFYIMNLITFRGWCVGRWEWIIRIIMY